MESKLHPVFLYSSLKPIDLPWTNGPSPEFPMFGVKLACGLFGISEDFIEKYQSLDMHFVKNKFSTFFLQADGDSMEPTIFAGQVIIVDRSRKDFDGKVCVVVLEDTLTCKRVFFRNNSIILKSDNPKYKDIIVQDNQNILFWGLVIANAGFVK
jgi:DNA polymerase V